MNDNFAAIRNFIKGDRLPDVLETFARFSSIGVLGTLCALLIAQGLRPRITVYALFFFLSSICLLIVSGPPELRVQGALAIPLMLTANLIFVFAWRFGLAVFDDDVTLGPIAWSVLAFCVVGPALDMVKNEDWFPIDGLDLGGMRLAYILISLGLMLHLAYRAYRGRRHDLVEQRRRYRVGFLLGIATLMIVILVANEVGRNQPAVDMSLLVFLAPPFALGMALWTVRLHPETMAFEYAEVSKAQTGKKEVSLPVSKELERLTALMANEHIYRRHGLTITVLADEMGLQERKLRELINKQLEFRNFATFLNSYRIEEVKAQLSDPDFEHVPILTLAMDAGFASISPFNTVFRKMTGLSPTEFRNQSLKNG